MHYPAFIAEMGLRSNRPKLWAGVWSGYGIAIAFELLVLAGQWLDVVPWAWSFHALVLAKLVTNTLMLLALRYDIAVLEISGANTVMDVVVMTGAIYLTGGMSSPLFVIYVIEVSVIAMLSNRGVTIMIAFIVVAMYAAMAIAIHNAWLTQHPSPLRIGELTTAHVVLGILFSTFVIALPTTYTSAILRVLRRKELELEARTHELMEAGRQKSQFMANITHELRTPIHGISAVTELIDSEVYGPVTAQQREACDAITKSAHDLLSLVDDLLLLSKAEAAKLELKSTDFEVAPLVEAVSSSVRWMVEMKKLTFEATLPDTLPWLNTDRGKLNQILMNLIANAIKFTPAGGHIGLAVSANDGAVTFAVSDTGIGIPADQLPHVFEEFRQIDGSDERSHGGIGLGLALVKKLADLLGAELDAQSTHGDGSRFSITVPKRRPTQPP